MEPEQYQNNENLKHSKLAIISFCLSIVTVFYIAAVMIMNGNDEITYEGIIKFLLVLLLLSVPAFTMAFIDIRKKNRKKSLTIFALAVSGSVLFLVVILFILMNFNITGKDKERSE